MQASISFFSNNRLERADNAITAPIVVEATERVAKGLAKPSGVVAAGEVFDARDFPWSLSPAHLAFEL
jgi:hypothetical protein